MTNARIQRGFQTNTLRGTMVRKKRGVNSRTLLLLLLPTLMVMLMLVGMTMPGMSAADDMTSQAGTESAKTTPLLPGSTRRRRIWLTIPK